MKKHTHTLLLTLTLLLGFVGSTAQAADQALFGLETVAANDGFVTRQPAVSAGQLQAAIDETSRYLLNRHAGLEKDIEKHRKAGNNLILAAVMPGGLLYMAYHKGQQHSSQTALEAVEQAQTELVADRDRLQLDATPVIVARFP